MTIQLSVTDAKNQFSELIQHIKAGEEVSISEAGIIIAKIVPIPEPQIPRVPGQDRGKVFISSDFDEPLPPDILDGFLNPADPQP